MAQVLGGALLFGAIGLVAKSLVQTAPAGDGDWDLTNRDRVAAVLIGAFGGFIVGLTSVGSGVFFGLTLLILFPLRAHKVVGTDIFHAAALLYVAGLGHWLAGNVDFGLLGWLLLGSIPGVLIGGRLSSDSRAGAAAPARRRARARRRQAARRAGRRRDRRRRAGGGRRRAPRLDRTAQLDAVLQAQQGSGRARVAR